MYILTGSSVPVDISKMEHSGTGRYARIKMRPMSLFESGESNGEVNIKALFDENPGESLASVNGLSVEDISYLVCRGGWPRAVLQKDKEIALDQALNYYESVINNDIRVDGINRNEQRARLLMRSYARNQGAQVSNAALKADMDANDSQTLDEDTVLSYVNALKKIFVVAINFSVRVAVEDVPNFAFAALIFVRQGVSVVGVHLHGQIVVRVD